MLTHSPLTSRQFTQQQLVQHMPFVHRTEQELEQLGEWWQRVTLIGKISSLQIAKTLLDEMDVTQRRFQELQRRLVESLTQEKLRKLNLDLSSRAQVAIDILIRNLFERTADVGFLATDRYIRAFLHNDTPTEADRAAIVERLRAYIAKYSVYDEVILLNPSGQLSAHLDVDNPVAAIRDPLPAQLLSATDTPYLEIFRPSDLQPLKRSAHIFAARITESDDPDSRLLGILCLCFRFDDELQGIFAQLAQEGLLLAILDSNNQVIASSDEARVPFADRLQPAPQGALGRASYRGTEYLVRTASTNGYQEYMGLPWRGHAMLPLDAAFKHEVDLTAPSGRSAAPLVQVQQGALTEISQAAAKVTADLTLTVINGQILSVKQDAQQFMPVLNEIRTIAQKTREVFDHSIEVLQQTISDTLLADAVFQASLAVDIMDRNLYERANDVRWWALTHDFRKYLADPEEALAKRAQLAAILAYINDLYTVYTNLLLFDLHGRVVAVSRPEQERLIGTVLPPELPVSRALQNEDPQRYVVSDFVATPLYAGQYTYVYMTAVHALESRRTVGGMAIVFDAAPQFHAMLQDALPHDESGAVSPGAFGLFVEPGGRIVASTHVDLCVGETLSIDIDLAGLKSAKRTGRLVRFNGESYAVGAVMSQGYREYKTTNDYRNDIIALIFMPA
ncbi:hypothetical protein CKO15_05450 [Halorhodospira abdelmalekii]|uniref:cache domain-containing protein n=1 Tax=Halorhodospira abdelmalekii TaxID=421629 RepID=UPI00190334F3|nr:cache domain-containing protein [Halorhodospira abdelmalekii]MBK1734741.1 hypothetical protein [Halorhodospira abdelmalekii]